MARTMGLLRVRRTERPEGERVRVPREEPNEQHNQSDEEGDNEADQNGIGVEEEVVEDLSNHFGDDARNEGDVSDGDSGDDIWDDDKIPDPLSSDDDEEEYERREEAANTLGCEELLYLGKTYGCASDFKVALLRYSLRSRYDIRLYKSCAKALGAKCSDVESKCPWRIYCSYERRRHKMQVKVFVNEHCCIRSGYSKMLKTSSIATLFEERLRINPKFTRTEMVNEIKREYNLTVTEEQCGKAKSKLYRERKASHEAHFSRIWDYQAEVLKSNPYSTMKIETVPGPVVQSKQRFDRLYMCFTAQRETWIETCRPIIGLDGAFLKWDIKGHLLAAVGRDGDNRIVPIAWAVVEVENNINWEWFVRLLKEDLGLQDGSKFTIISDKQKGLVNAVKNELPEAEHRMCARHILSNWKRDSKDPELERMFWKIAGCYTVGEFEEALEVLKKYNKGAFDTLQLQNPRTWSRAFFRVGSFCNDNLNNLCESFNKTIREARKKPLLEMLEDIRRQSMVRHAKRAILANRLKTHFTKKVHAEIELNKENAKECRRYLACGNVHEVDDHSVAYSVDMDLKTCGCIKWQLTGIPCIHASCVITAKKIRTEDYVAGYYTAQKWRETYSRGIRPVQGMKLWPRLNRLGVLPPPFRLGKRGRPSNYDRKKGLNENSSKKTKMTRDGRVITCSNCLDQGHNKVTCPNDKVESAPKRPRGRPRKNLGEFSQAQGSSQ
ncbi:uncharacterized protein LOC108808175 [Raphanus sativus]|uniref:Uncharacterized protein LOC108808175 n=1 Tax=Raphanus sativus TaxID=3726 RepID=A0A9W3DLI8_RAPSA|nr:uncharacterized protein LOC108808175 [Raphanus sativus]